VLFNVAADYYIVVTGKKTRPLVKILYQEQKHLPNAVILVWVNALHPDGNYFSA
jgi:hypothetical protein